MIAKWVIVMVIFQGGNLQWVEYNDFATRQACDQMVGHLFDLAIKDNTPLENMMADCYIKLEKK